MAAAAARQAPPSASDLQLLRQQCETRLSELKLDRTTYEYDWHQISELIVPLRGRYLPQYNTKRPRRSGKFILDPTGTKAHQRLASFLMAGITNPALNWFRLGIVGEKMSTAPGAQPGLMEDPEVKSYLAACQDVLYRVFSEGNFYPSMHQTYEEIGAFGTGAMICLEDFDDVVRFYPLTTGEYWLALNKRQECDTLYREYTLTVGQMVEEFGLENCSAGVQGLYESKRLSARFVIGHAIQPNRDVKAVLGWRGKAYHSLYWERGQTNGFLRTEGFAFRPFIAPRWHALAGDAYGSGPGFQALPDVKSLQTTTKILAQGNEKQVNPPVMGDAKYRNSFLGLLPDDVNWIDGIDMSPHAGLRPIYQVTQNLTPMQADKEAYRTTIKETFFNDLILAISQMDGIQPRNEMEISERRNEKMLMLGPVLERFYTEALAPVVRMVFDVAQRGRILPPPPKALHGKQVAPVFVSVLAQAQKAVGTSALEQFLRIIGSMMAAFPTVGDKFDTDRFVERYGEDLEIPPDLIRSQAAVDAMRTDKQQQAQQAALLQQAGGLAAGAKALGDTNVGGGQSALGLISGLGR